MMPRPQLVSDLPRMNRPPVLDYSPFLPTIDSVLFVVDGTLVDSLDARAQSWLTALAAYGYPATLIQIRRLLGMSTSYLLYILTGLSPDSAEGAAIMAYRSAIFTAHYLPTLHAFPGAKALLAQLRADGLTLTATTVDPDDEVDLLLDAAGLAQLLDHLPLHFNGERSYPDSLTATLARRRVERLLIVGATPYDVAAANKANLPLIALSSGGWSALDLRGAFAIFDNLADLLAGYNELPLLRVSPRLIRGFSC